MNLIGLEKLSKLVKVVEEAENIVITTHVDPDGDAIGSSLAVYNILKEYFEKKNIFKQIDVVIKDIPPIFKILDGFYEIKEDFDNNIDFLIVLDLNMSDRLRKVRIFN